MGLWRKETGRLHGGAWTRREFLARTSAAGLGLLGARRLGAQADEPVVHTRYGALRGVALPGCTIFRGVPFAAPPRRFRPPEPPARWSGERDATRFALAAAQPDLPSEAQSEDCLYANVWTPASPGPHPVLVWIHGGGFTSGRTSDPLLDGAVFARQGIVTVTVAYRLGVFGFLDVSPLLGEAYRGSANNGLRDLLQALGWVRETIADFGGDPTRVTLGGQSAGAKLADILLGIPSAAGLFGQVISESGGAERVASTAAAMEVARGFGKMWAEDSGAGLTALAAAPAPQLLLAQSSFTKSWPLHFPLRPALDPELMPRLPVEQVAAGSSRGKRLLLGTNRDESAFFVGPHPEQVTAAELGNVGLAPFEAVAAKYRKAYPKEEPSRLRIRELTAEEYWVPSLRLLQACVRGGGTAHAYRFDYARDTGRLAGLAYHSLELQLLWADEQATSAATPEAALARAMQAAWVAFVRTGTPATPSLPPWPEYRLAERAAMVLDVESRLVSPYGDEELALWTGVL